MNIWIRRGLQLSAFSVGIFALGVGVASAAESGPQQDVVLLDPVGQVVSAPISVTDNAITVLGGSQTGAGATQSSAASDGSGSDTTLIDVPVTVQGNAFSIGGADASADTRQTQVTTAPGSGGALLSAPVDISNNAVAAGEVSAETTAETDGTYPAAGDAIVAVPVAVTGNSVAVLGGADATEAKRPTPAADDAASAPTRSGGALVDAPVTVCGNAASVLGDAATSCAPQTDAADGSLIAAPVRVCGTSLGVTSGATSACPTYLAAGYLRAPTEPIIVGERGAADAPSAGSGSVDRPNVPGSGVAPEQADPATIEPEAASESLSPSAVTAGDLAYTGMDLAGPLAAGVLALLLGIGGVFGAHARLRPRPSV